MKAPTPTIDTDERKVEIEHRNEIWTFYGDECTELFARINATKGEDRHALDAAKEYARELGYQPRPSDEPEPTA